MKRILTLLTLCLALPLSVNNQSAFAQSELPGLELIFVRWVAVEQPLKSTPVDIEPEVAGLLTKSELTSLRAHCPVYGRLTEPRKFTFGSQQESPRRLVIVMRRQLTSEGRIVRLPVRNVPDCFYIQSPEGVEGWGSCSGDTTQTDSNVFLRINRNDPSLTEFKVDHPGNKPGYEAIFKWQ